MWLCSDSLSEGFGICPVRAAVVDVCSSELGVGVVLLVRALLVSLG